MFRRPLRHILAETWSPNVCCEVGQEVRYGLCELVDRVTEQELHVFIKRHGLASVPHIIFYNGIEDRFFHLGELMKRREAVIAHLALSKPLKQGWDE